MLRATHNPPDKTPPRKPRLNAHKPGFARLPHEPVLGSEGELCLSPRLHRQFPITVQLVQGIQNLHLTDPDPFVRLNSTGASRILLRQTLNLSAAFKHV